MMQIITIAAAIQENPPTPFAMREKKFHDKSSIIKPLETTLNVY
jgi:hypothetical protein